MYFLIIFLSLRSDVKPLVAFTVFRHFNTNGKKFTVSINFSVKNKIGSKKVSNILYSISSSFGHFPTIPDYFKRSAKTIEDGRRLQKISEEESDYFHLYFRHHIFTCERCILLQCTDTTFSVRESYVIHSN